MSRRSGGLLTGIVLLLVTGTARAAPAPLGPAPARLADIERYLFDDTDMLAVLDVRAALRSPSFKGVLNNPVLATALKSPEGGLRVLGDSGIDWMRDVDCVVAVSARSCYSDTESEDGVLILVQGRFDPQVRGKLSRLAQAGKPGYHVAVLDASTIAITPNKKLVAQAVARSGGKRQPKLTHAAMARFVKGLKNDRPFQLFMLESAVIGSAPAKPGAGGPKAVKVRHTTLADQKIASLQVRVESDKQLRAVADLTFKSQADADTMSGQIQAILGIVPATLKQHEMAKQLQPVFTLIEGIKTRQEGQSCIIEGTAEHTTVAAAIEALTKLAKP